MTLNRKEQKKTNKAFIVTFKKRNLTDFNNLIENGAVFDPKIGLEFFIKDNDSSIFQDPFFKEILSQYSHFFVSTTNSAPTSAIHYILLFSIEANYNHIVDYVLDNFVEQISQDTLIQAFSSACYHCHFSIIQKLISLGVDINTNNGEALFRSVERNRLDVFNYLIEQNADVNINNYNALQMACAKYSDYYKDVNDPSYYMLKTLFRFCDNIHFNNDHLLSLAIGESNHYIIPFLLSHIDLTSEQHLDCSFLIQAFESDNIESLETFQLLLPLYSDLTQFNQHLYKEKYIKENNNISDNKITYKTIKLNNSTFCPENLLSFVFINDYILDIAKNCPTIKDKLDFYEKYLTSCHFSTYLEQELSTENNYIHNQLTPPIYFEQLELFSQDKDNLTDLINLKDLKNGNGKVDEGQKNIVNPEHHVKSTTSKKNKL